MTTAVAPSTPETDFHQRELEIHARRAPPTQEADTALQRQNSTRSQHGGLERKKHQSQESLRRPNERRKVMRIGNYVVNRKTIGAGSMGKVKLATCLAEGDRQQYAVKVMPKVNLAALADTDPSQAKDPKDTPQEREQRTVREMAMMQLLRHPNICQLKEWINEGDLYYMFLEYVDGGQLLDYIIQHGKLREKQARKFARQIASALDYCHRNSIVHRDLKIENIMLTRNEDVKIIDFGLSNIYSPAGLLSTFCGSLYFAAPELLRARPYVGPEVDVWSFGVVLYVLVCGRVPFDDTNLPALHAKIKAGQVDAYPEHLTKDCVDLLMRILVVDPKRRITLPQILTHPWMTRGYDEPIQNHLPHRQPLDTIEREIVEGMGGFGFADPQQVYDRLETLILDPAYRQAAAQIDQNYQQQLLNQEQTVKSRWRLSLRSKRGAVVQDDPLSLPAMYDPLLSIYYLVKEKKEYEKRQRQLKRGQQTATQPPPPQSAVAPPLRRSNSTTTTSPRRNTSLIRRKTDRTPSTPRLDSAAYNANNGTGNDISRSGSINFPGRSNSIRGMSSTLLARSRSAVRRLGANFRNTNIQTDGIDQDGNSNAAKKNFLKLDPASKDDKPRSSWRRLSISRTNSRYTRPSLEIPSANGSLQRSVSSTARHSVASDDAVSSASTPKLSSSSHQPKVLFNFNRKHLYKFTPQKLIDDLNDILWLYNIRSQSSATDQYILLCECDYPYWTKFTDKNNDSFNHQQAETLRFTIMIYQARLAGGRLGIKIKESEEADEQSRVYKNIHEAILQDLDKIAGRHI